MNFGIAKPEKESQIPVSKYSFKVTKFRTENIDKFCDVYLGAMIP